MEKKRKILIFGNQFSGHNNPILGIVSSIVSKGYEIDFCITEDFKEEVAKFPCQFIFYPCEVQEITRLLIPKVIEKVQKNLSNDNFLSSKFVFEMQHAVAKVIVPWALETLKPEDYLFVIYDFFSIWSNCLAVKWKLPEINSTPTFKGPRHLCSKLEDEESKACIENFNKEFGTNWTTVCDILNCDNAEKIILYTSHYFHYYNDQIPIEKVFYTSKFDGNTFQAGRKTFKSGSLIYFSLGTLFNRDMELLRNAMHTLGKFKNYKVLFSLGKAKDIYEQIRRENIYENIEMVEWADQKKVLYEASLFITHAGFNSVRESIQGSTPMILCPQSADQPFVAGRVLELGAGLVINQIDRKDDDLEKAILQIEHNYDCFLDNVLKIQESYMNTLDGGELMDEIEKYLNYKDPLLKIQTNKI